MDMRNFPVCYQNQVKAWMNQQIKKNGFLMNLCHLKSKNLSQKATLLLDNAPSQPDENLLQTADGQIFV